MTACTELDHTGVEMLYRGLNIALIVPCYNGEQTVGQVLREIRQAMPELQLFVFDNASTDATAVLARAEFATVITVPLKGKGNVVRRMFSDVDADVYVMVDGDATYHAESVKVMVDKLIDQRLDMVVGCRKTNKELLAAAYRSGHQWGNSILTKSVMSIFGGRFTDMLSGYRVFSQRYVKSMPVLSQGFEIETELTVHALELRMPYGEVDTPYGARPEGSTSKLSTYKDGIRIATTIVRLYASERPLTFCGLIALLTGIIAIALAIPLLSEYVHSGLVPRLPTAVLAASLVVCASISSVCGLILHSVTLARHEAKRLAYLAIALPKVT